MCMNVYYPYMVTNSLVHMYYDLCMENCMHNRPYIIMYICTIRLCFPIGLTNTRGLHGISRCSADDHSMITVSVHIHMHESVSIHVNTFSIRALTFTIHATATSNPDASVTPDANPSTVLTHLSGSACMLC